MQPCILLTGVTGFLGKVVLEELCRRRFENSLPPHRIIVLIRCKNGKGALQRFDQLVNSLCFSTLKGDWTAAVEVTDGDMQVPQCGLKDEVYQRMCRQITHIIHCAASVDFSLSLADAARTNIDGALNALKLARDCLHLKRMVDISTAYVNTVSSGPIEETLAPLPQPAEVLHMAIQKNKINEKELLRSSGHPNTYTLTKCIAEHLVAERRGSLPVTIVRPSIISASLKHPFPGWIDSRAALGGCIAMLGSGFLHAMVARQTNILDIVPVDIVTEHLIDESQLAEYRASEAAEAACNWKIVHSVAGLGKGCSFAMVVSVSLDYFGQNVVFRAPYVNYTGPKNLSYHWHQGTSQQLPLRWALIYYKATRQPSMLKKTRTLKRCLKKMNTGFPYFCSNSFDFRTLKSIDLEPHEYIGIVSRGVHRHLLLGET